MNGVIDPSLFSDEAVPADTRQINDAIVKAMTGMPEWWDVGAEKVRAVVVEYLRTHATQISEPEILAPFFLEIMRGRHQYRALADESYHLSDKDLTLHVRNAVRFFLNGAQTPVFCSSWR